MPTKKSGSTSTIVVPMRMNPMTMNNPSRGQKTGLVMRHDVEILAPTPRRVRGSMQSRLEKMSFVESTIRMQISTSTTRMAVTVMAGTAAEVSPNKRGCGELYQLGSNSIRLRVAEVLLIRGAAVNVADPVGNTVVGYSVFCSCWDSLVPPGNGWRIRAFLGELSDASKAGERIRTIDIHVGNKSLYADVDLQSQNLRGDDSGSTQYLAFLRLRFRYERQLDGQLWFRRAVATRHHERDKECSCQRHRHGHHG